MSTDVCFKLKQLNKRSGAPLTFAVLTVTFSNPRANTSILGFGMKGNDVRQKDNGTDKVREGGKLHISPPSLPALQLQLIHALLEVSTIQL